MKPMNPKGFKLPQGSHEGGGVGGGDDQRSHTGEGKDSPESNKKTDLNPRPARYHTQFRHLLDHQAGEAEPRQ